MSWIVAKHSANKHSVSCWHFLQTFRIVNSLPNVAHFFLLSLDEKWTEQDKDGMWVLTNHSSCPHEVSSSSKWERGARKTIQCRVHKCWDMVKYNGINEHVEIKANLIFEDKGTSWGGGHLSWGLKNEKLSQQRVGERIKQKAQRVQTLRWERTWCGTYKVNITLLFINGKTKAQTLSGLIKAILLVKCRTQIKCTSI